MPTVGGSDHFILYGDTIRLIQGRLVNSEGSLAGAHVTMAASVARLINVLGAAPQTALRMAITVPARVLNAPHLAALQGRAACDLLILGPDWQVLGTVM